MDRLKRALIAPSVSPARTRYSVNNGASVGVGSDVSVGSTVAVGVLSFPNESENSGRDVAVGRAEGCPVGVASPEQATSNKRTGRSKERRRSMIDSSRVAGYCINLKRCDK